MSEVPLYKTSPFAKVPSDHPLSAIWSRTHEYPRARDQPHRVTSTNLKIQYFKYAFFLDWAGSEMVEGLEFRIAPRVLMLGGYLFDLLLLVLLLLLLLFLEHLLQHLRLLLSRRIHL